MMEKVKITVIKKFNPDEIFGHEIIHASGKPIPQCPFFEEGQEIFAENSFIKPEEFCGWAWRDLTVRFTKFDLLEDEEWPKKGETYVACGDGIRPVIFKLEKLE
ncbi:MAG: TIGR04076 family protein [Candidatus Kariarchaeaceae archaeon]|jgi:uncharacterized repeat protein (TIGR04076 family)